MLPPSPAKKSDPSVRVIGRSALQCVLYVRQVTGNGKVHGYAGNLVAEGGVPKVGAAALEKGYGHVSVVVALAGDKVVLHDSNWIKGAVTERIVTLSEIRGYIY